MSRVVVILLLLMFGASACVSNRSVQIEPGGEITADGLYRLNQGTFDQAWALPDLDLAGYRAVMLAPVEIAFREVDARNRAGFRLSGESDFSISEPARTKLHDTLRDAFLAELATSTRYELASTPGPGVLLVRAALLDVVSHVPPEPIGRSDIYLDSVGEATLMLELRDAQSDALLARAVDRRAAERAGMLIKVNRVTAWSEARIVAKAWARLLRQRLDEFTRVDTGSSGDTERSG